MNMVIHNISNLYKIVPVCKICIKRYCKQVYTYIMRSSFGMIVWWLLYDYFKNIAFGKLRASHWSRNHYDEICVIGCTGSCHCDNFQCIQWWKFQQNYKTSVSLLMPQYNGLCLSRQRYNVGMFDIKSPEMEYDAVMTWTHLCRDFICWFSPR